MLWQDQICKGYEGFEYRLTRTKLTNFGWFTGTEGFGVDLVPIGADSQGSCYILDLGTVSSHIECDRALCTVIFDMEFGDGDSRVIQAAGEPGGLKYVCA